MHIRAYTNRDNCKFIRDINWAHVAFPVIPRQAVVSTFVNHNSFEVQEGFASLGRLRFPLRNNTLGRLAAFRPVIESQIHPRRTRN